MTAVQTRGGACTTASADAATAAALRDQLNGRGHLLPLSKASGPLVAHILADVTSLSDKIDDQRAVEAQQERSLHVFRSELQAARTALPGLLKENTALHRQVLESSDRHEERRQQGRSKIASKQAALESLRQLRSADLRRKSQLESQAHSLRNRLAALGLHPRASEAAVRASSNKASQERCRSLAQEVASATLELHSERQVLAQRGEKLQETEELQQQKKTNNNSNNNNNAQTQSSSQSPSAANENSSGRRSAAGYDQDGVDLLAPTQEEVDELTKQARLLRADCDTWQRRKDDLSTARSEASELVTHLAKRQELLRQESQALKARSAVMRTELEASRVDLQAFELADSQEHRVQRSAEAALQKEHQHFVGRLCELEVALASKSKADDESLTELREALSKLEATEADEKKGQLERDEQLQALRLELESSAARRTALTSRLAAVKMHEAAQKSLAATREEEAEAYRQQRKEGLQKNASMDQQLKALEAATTIASSESVELRAFLNEASATLSELKEEKAAADARQSALEAEVRSARSQRERGSEELEETRAKLRSEDQELRQLRLQESECEQSLLDQKHLIRSREERLSAVRRAHRALSAEVPQVLSELSKLTAERRSEGAMESELSMLLDESQQDLSSVADRYANGPPLDAELDQLRRALREAEGSFQSLQRSELATQRATEDRLATVEPSLVEMKREVQRLLAQRGRLIETLRRKEEAGAEAWAAVEERRSEAATNRLSSLRSDEKSAEEKVRNLARELRAASAEARKHEEDLAEARRASEVASREEREVEREAELQKEELSECVNAVAVATHSLKEFRAAGIQGEEALNELLKQRSQLSGLVEGASAARTRLAKALREAEDDLEEEERLGRELLGGTFGALRERLQELRSEGERLRQATESVEHDRVDLEALLGERQKRLRSLKSDFAQLQTSGGEVQWTLDQLRHDAQSQQGQLDETHREASHFLSELEVAEEEIRKLEASVSEEEQEASAGMANLLHMTKENQILRSQLEQMREREAALVANDSKLKAMELPKHQELQGYELECESAVHSYRRALEERQRQGEALAALAKRGFRAEQEVEDAHGALEVATAHEQEAQQEVWMMNSELMTLKAELSAASSALQRQAFDHQQDGIERSRLQRALVAQQAEASRSALRNAQAEAEADRLRKETDLLQRELQDTRIAFTAAQESRRQAELQERQLQALLSQQRQLQHRLESDRQALSGQLMRGELEQARRSREAPISARSENPAEASNLEATLEEQNCLLQEMQAERVQLQEEIDRLTSELRSRSAGHQR